MQIPELISLLQEYAQKNPHSRESSDQIIAWVREHREFAFVRENLEGHITGSLLITNPEKTKVLLIFHKKLQKWLQFGGHADGEIDVKNVAIREFHEESGIDLEPEMIGGIFLAGIHRIPEYQGTPAHNHLDIFYLGIIPDDTPFARQESEVDDIRWFDIDGIEQYIDADMCERIKNI